MRFFIFLDVSMPIPKLIKNDIHFLRMILLTYVNGRLSSWGLRGSCSTSCFYVEKKIFLIVLDNLYPIKHWSTLHAFRLMFMYDLFHKEPIDLCHHMFHAMCMSSWHKRARNGLPYSSHVTKLLLTMCVCRPRGFVVVHHQALIGLRSLIKRQAHLHRFLPTPLVQVPAAAPTKAHGDTKDKIDGYEVIPNALASLADSAPQKTV